MEQLDHLLVVQRDFCGNKRMFFIVLIVHGIRSNVILKSTDHGRIIVSEDIQFQQVVVNGMVVKMCCDDPALHIVSRMLYRSKFIDVMSVRKYDNTSRMLPGTAPDPGAAYRDPLNLTAAFPLLTFLIIILYKSISRLVSQRADRSRFKSMSFTEQYLCVFMGLCLIISGKVQVDIRLLVSLETEECLKRNIKAGLNKRLAAHRAVLIRHVKSAASGKCPYLFRLKVTVMALFAVIVRAQRIYLRDSRHSGNERGTYRSPGSHEITVRIGFPYQFLCDDIHNCIAIGNNGVKLFLQALRHLDRKILTVHFMSLPVTYIS